MASIDNKGGVGSLMGTVLQLDVQMTHVEQHTSEGTWYLITDAKQVHYFRCNKKAWDFINLFDGHKTLSEVIHETVFNVDDEAADREELDSVIAQLLSMGVLYRNENKLEKKHWVEKLKQPMAIKVPLFNPDMILNQLSKLGCILFNRYFFTLYILLFFYSVALIPLNESDISFHWSTRFFDPLNILCMLIIYPVLKIFHEFGHGVSLKYFGGQAKECGIVFLVLIPLPYIEASSSYLFPEKYKRVIVGLSGMLVELFVAMIAWLSWCAIDNVGLFSDILFDIVFIGGFSTLVFNINPLMKFDGYYILSDVLSIYNLNSRSRSLIGSLFKKYILGIEGFTSYIARYEYKWLLIYGFLAIPYRLFISIFIALYLSTKFFVFGVLLAAWVVVQQMLLPLVRGVYSTYKIAKVEKKKKRFTSVILGLFVIAFVFGVALKFQYSFSTTGIVFLNESQQLRANQDGFISEVYVRNGDRVLEGQKLIEIDNPSLLNAVFALKADIEELTARYDQVRAKDLLAAADLFDQRKGVMLELSEAREQKDKLTLVAMGEGVFVNSRLEDFQGGYVRRGDVIGFLHDKAPAVVTGIVDQMDIDKIRQQLSHISVMFVSNPGVVYRGEVRSIVPAASDQLPSRYLGSLEGGDIAVDGSDRRGTTAVRNHFVIQVTVPQINKMMHKPATAQLKFVFHERSLLSRFSTWLKVNWLRNFSDFH